MSSLWSCIIVMTAIDTVSAQPDVPSPSGPQSVALRHTFSMFMHYSLCTYTSWCDGTWDIPPGDPATFNPDGLNTDQWINAAVLAGATQVCLTVRHVDGFALWPTKSNNYSVAASPWRNGTGDVVAEFVRSARMYGISPCCESHADSLDTMHFCQECLSSLRCSLHHPGVQCVGKLLGCARPGIPGPATSGTH